MKFICIPFILTVAFLSSISKILGSNEPSYFSIHTNLSNLILHLNDSAFTFVAVFDSLFPGDKFLEYQEFAKRTNSVNELSVYHMIHNLNVPSVENVFHKFNLTFVDLPYYLLFCREQPNPIVYRGSWKSEDIVRWVASVTGLRLPLPGCIGSLDILAHRARKADTRELNEHILPEIRRLLSMEPHLSSSSAQFYIQAATHLATRGTAYLSTEAARLKRLVDNEVSDEQKAKLKERLNIIIQFMEPSEMRSEQKTEL
ncbi:endoplasmic reticulum protein ERp29 domain protein [Opisthorchis viverrini]|uniref:Endoplasmic reticulum protein ERp29 domain protein n=2 Tax=Opisthorchis viverrini TaxID=6198 RepID=A0A1S8X3G9_OPIVI|nr:hypothetical protein T265_02164 [Opisthorchis viverrini]KER31658.1 hypothetical protein T265_02164 [Opisthorchis viverrini]OON21255.1 endoplasmic reticulum protein ERp29 domain protein [Opisthorchis viverrini]